MIELGGGVVGGDKGLMWGDAMDSTRSYELVSTTLIGAILVFVHGHVVALSWVGHLLAFAFWIVGGLAWGCGAHVG